MRKFELIVLLAAASWAMCGITSAEVPNLMNYQGRLNDVSGNPVDDGEYQMTFTIYADLIADTVIWSESYSAVSVTGGLFNVMLGSSNPLSQSIFNETERFLGIQVGSDTEISPRSRLVTVPFAFTAHSVSGDYDSTLVDYLCNLLIAAGNAVQQILNNVNAKVYAEGELAMAVNNFGKDFIFNGINGYSVDGYYNLAIPSQDSLQRWILRDLIPTCRSWADSCLAAYGDTIQLAMDMGWTDLLIQYDDSVYWHGVFGIFDKVKEIGQKGVDWVKDNKEKVADYAEFGLEKGLEDIPGVGPQVKKGYDIGRKILDEVR
ncbi:MAG: hypothetical protein AB1746_14020 [Candidatus Zixiibacteriota bacterium]